MEKKQINLKNKELRSLLDQFESKTLSQIKKVSLLKRVETKYIMNYTTFIEALKKLKNDYFVLSVEDNKINNYQTLYYDTKKYDLFNSHHNGKLNRYKVRTREYKDTNISFMEVKFKDNKKKTIKDRIKVKDISKNLTQESSKLNQTCPIQPV